MAHKRSVATTLLRRAVNIPSSCQEKKAELQHVEEVLRDNNYPDHFIKKCVERSTSCNPNSSSNSHDEIDKAMVVLPYVSGVSEKIGRALKPYGIKTAHKPISKMSKIGRAHV